MRVAPCVGLLLSAFLSLAASTLDGDLDLLLKRFPGDYDNYLQWEKEIEDNVTISQQHGHLHSIFYGPVNLPSFGEHVFYVQQYTDGTPTKIYRQRLYVFSLNQTSNDIVLSFFTFLDPAKYVDAQKDPEKLSKLTRSETAPASDKCNVHIVRHGDIFVGSTTKECVVVDHRSGKSIRIEDNNQFGKDFVSIHERGFDVETGTQIFGNPTPDVLNRTRAARRFSGYVALESSTGAYQLMSNVSVWDVGQIVPVVTDDGVRTKYAVEIAYCTYPNGDNVLKIAMHETGFVHDGKVVPVAYAWSQPDATQIGLNLRFVQAGFELVE